MGKIVVTEFMSIDGVIDEPRWTFGYNRGPEGDKFKYDELFAADAMLLGRVTYQGFAQAWPSYTDEEGFADRMNSIPRYVVSNTLSDADATWGPTTVIRGDVPAELTRLRKEYDGTLLVHGSVQLTHTLIEHGLADEYHLMVFPIILGAGKRFAPDTLAEGAKLTLSSVKAAPDGIQLLVYTPVQDAQ
jgi:dihydrofolate reductase